MEQESRLEFLKEVHSRRRSVWMQEAACADVSIADQKLYFLSDHMAPEDVREFKQFCLDCPVINECRDYARLHEKFGNYGGETWRERNKWRRKHPVELMDLLFNAVKYDWLESHNVCNNEDVKEVSSLVNLQTGQHQDRKIDPSSLVFEELDWGDLFGDSLPANSLPDLLPLPENPQPADNIHPTVLQTNLGHSTGIGSLLADSLQELLDASETRQDQQGTW